MSCTIHLLRHAAHDDVGRCLAGRNPDIHLGPRGLAQAERLAQRMRAETFASIHASPQPRTQQTARAIAALASMPIHTEPALDEIDFGRWTGVDFATLDNDPDWQRWNRTRAIARTPSGDGLRAAQTRILDLIDRLRAARPGAAVLLVSHADVIKAALLYYLGVSLDRFDVIDIAPASLSSVELDDWHARIVRLNETTP